MTFLDYYRENLAHIRGIASEFAGEFPKIASRLELSDYNCQDPYVERLLEGTAFLAARVEQKLESGFPRFLESVASSIVPLPSARSKRRRFPRFLESVASSIVPMATAPLPSYAVIRCTADLADERLRSVYVMKRGAQFKCKVPGVETPCVYSSIADVSVSAAVLGDVAYLTRELNENGIADSRGLAALKLTVIDGDGAGGATMSDDLLVYVDMPDSSASELQGQLCGDLCGVYARWEGRTVALDGVTVEIPLFASREDEMARVTGGLKTMIRFMACPRLFKFFRVTGLKSYFEKAHGQPFELFFVFSRRVDSFVRSIGPNSIRLGCVPVVNVFRRHADRTECNGAFEHHIMADRTAPQNVEVIDVSSVEAYDARNQALFKALPGFEGDGEDRFVLHRRARLFDPVRSRSTYHGTEAYVSLSGADYDAHHNEIRQIGAELLCSNRDLPLLLRKEDPIQPPAGEPIAAAVFADQPSAPRAPLLGGGSPADWEKLGILSINLSSVLWRNGLVPVDVVRRIVKTCAFDDEGVAARLADAITEIKSTPRTFRFVTGGSPYFESGWRVDLVLKEDICSGTGVFIFARMLKELFLSYVPINTCIEFVVGTDRRKEVFRWVA